jgi:DNA-binding NtrC family response regulator
MNATLPQNNSDNAASQLQDPHRVLIVDDEPAICFAYGRLLENERFGFDICENVRDALNLLRSREYFAVISDVRFAGSDNADGVYLVSEIRSVQPKAKVILVTGYGSEELKRTAEALGTYDYLEKPVDPSLIVSILRGLHLIADEESENSDINLLALDQAELEPY